MAVLTSNIALPFRAPGGGIETDIQPMAGYTNFAGGNTAHIIYKGSIIIMDVSDTDGYVRAMPLSSSTAAAAGDVFFGVSAERQDVTSADTADGSVEVVTYKNGVWGFAVGSLSVTDKGAPIYASDDQTVTTTSTNNLWIGFLEDVDSARAWVDIAKAYGRTNTAT